MGAVTLEARYTRYVRHMYDTSSVFYVCLVRTLYECECMFSVTHSLYVCYCSCYLLLSSSLAHRVLPSGRTGDVTMGAAPFCSDEGCCVPFVDCTEVVSFDGAPAAALAVPGPCWP